MNPISKFLPPKKYLLLIPLALLGLIIWQYGPSLLLAHHYPLREPQKRLALILALFLAWAIKFLCLDYLQPLSRENQNLAQMLHALRGRFIGATKFLKKTIIDKHGYSTPLSQLPWYLLIGPPGSGKTSLLTHSNVNFILSKQKKQDLQEKTVTASSACDWWVTRDLVLVDVPGNYAFSPAKDPLNNSLSLPPKEGATTSESKSQAHLSLWQSLLQLLIKYRQKNNIGAIIVALPLPELIKQPRQQQTLWFQELKQRLNECWGKFGKVPVYFFITKCDLLPGFSEFFNDIGSDELMQPWGIPLAGRKEHEKLLDLFTERFNALIKRLNKQLIWRLHQERNPPSRFSIKDFPLQLELIRETLGQLIKSLTASNPDLELEGIYLCSATQENTATGSSTLFHHDLPSALEMLPSTPFLSRPYFIKHVISYLLPHTSQHLIQRFRQRKAWLPKLGYGLGFSFLIILALSLGRDFQRGLYQLSSVQHHLSEYQLYLQQNNSQESVVSAIANALPLLNTLQTAAQTVAPASRLDQLEAPYSSRSQHTAVAVYRKALQNIILPQVRNEFEKYLETSKDRNPEQLYVALKAYLMLRQSDSGTNKSNTLESKKLASQFIIHTLEQISPAFSKNSQNKVLTQTSFAQHLQNALQLRQGNSLNNHLINQTRKILNTLSDTDLAYILVKNMGNNTQESDLNFGTNIGTPPALISKGTMTQIPYMFTAQAFPLVIKDNIPLAAKEAVMGNEVIGLRSARPDALMSSTEAINTLGAQLEKTYINNYIDVWESLVDNISLNAPKNLTETDAMIMNLISTHSPLLQLLQTIHLNTDLDPILSSSLKLQTLNTLFNQTQSQQKDSLFELFTNLRELHQFLQQQALGMNSAQNLPKSGSLENNIQRVTADTLIKERLKAQQDSITNIRTVAEKYPEPIRNWLQTLVSYTQNYLQTEGKPTIINPKLSQNEPSTPAVATTAPLQIEKPVIISVIKEASPEEEPQIAPHHRTAMTMEKRIAAYTKKVAAYSKIRNLKIEKNAQSAFPGSSKEHLLAQNKNTDSPKTTRKAGSNPSEFVKVVASNDKQPLIFVQKD